METYQTPQNRPYIADIWTKDLASGLAWRRLRRDHDGYWGALQMDAMERSEGISCSMFSEASLSDNEQVGNMTEERIPSFRNILAPSKCHNHTP
jgi:hypothetical protein